MEQSESNVNRIKRENTRKYKNFTYKAQAYGRYMKINVHRTVGKELQSLKVLKTCMRDEELGNLKKINV